MRLIRKYPNRRLYDTEAGKFIKLSDLHELVEGGHDIRVEDKNSGEDITRALLLQIVTEAEAGGRPILSEHLLLALIRFQGHPLHDYMTSYLERSVDVFVGQVEQMQSRFGDLLDTGPGAALQDLTRNNLEWLQRMQAQWLPGNNERNDDNR